MKTKRKEIEHTRDCLSAQQHWQNDVEAYAKKWPDHCKVCKGWGGTVSYYDPSPRGVSLSSGTMSEFDPCLVCLGMDNCPRCGKHIDLEDDGTYFDEYVCSHCGWHEGDDGIPEEPECWCGYQDPINIFEDR